MNAPAARHGRRVRRRGERVAATAAARLAGALLLALVVLAPAGRCQQAPAGLPFAEALSRARQGPALESAELALAGARAARDASFALVTGTLQGGYSQSWSDVGGSASQRGGLEPFSLSATLNVVPYGPGYDARLDAERAVGTAQLELSDARAQATVDAARAYLAALRAQQRLALGARALTLASATLEHLRTQLASGDASAGSVADAQLAVEQARTTLATERLTLEGALADLADLGSGAVTSVAGEPPASHDPPATAPGAAVERRSDVRAGALALEAARRSYQADLRSRLPSVRAAADLQGGDGTTRWSAGLNYGTSSFQPGVQASVTPGGATTGDGGTTGVLNGTRFALSLSLSVPIDSGLAPGLAAARLGLASAEARLAQTRRQAGSALEAAHRSLRSARLAADLADAQRRRAEARAADAAERFRLGLIARPELDQARLDADGAAVDARGASDAVLLARLQLAQALGLDPMEVF